MSDEQALAPVTSGPSGIAGLRGKIPFGAIVTVGHKGPSGAPTNTDRYYIASPEMETTDGKPTSGSYRKLRHPLHPDFRAFNALKPDDPRAKRLTGHLLFAQQGQAFSHQLVARQLGRGRGTPPGGGTYETPPRGLPACVGNGETARRYAGTKDGAPSFVDIPCPNRECAFRQMENKVCGAFGRLYFRLSWPEGNPLPTCMVRFTSHSWDTVANMLGLFETVRAVAEGMGLGSEYWAYTGLPFEMRVGYTHQPDKGRRFPVTTFTVRDPVSFLTWQAQTRQALLAAPKAAVLLSAGAATDGELPGEEGSPGAIAEALDDVAGPEDEDGELIDEAAIQAEIQCEKE